MTQHFHSWVYIQQKWVFMSTLGIHICKYMFKKCLLKLFHYKHIFIPENLENAKKEKEGSFAHPSLPFAFSSHRPNTVISQ